MKKLLAILSAVGAILISTATASAATYYVSNAGKDTNDGLSANTAWRTIEKVNQTNFLPGDEILFEKGGVWSGSLWMSSSGEKDAPITVASYGAGSKPTINGDGANTAIYLHNQEYVTIRDLEVTNRGESSWRYGVYVSAYNAGDVCGVEIKNITVHDVNGHYIRADASETPDNHWNGGIIAQARGTKATRFVGLKIKDCEIYNCARTGIATVMNWNTAFDKKEEGQTKDLEISGNVIHNVKGDGLIVSGDRYGKITGNTIYNSAMMLPENGCQDVNVGLFVLHSLGTVASGNEVYQTQTTYDGFGYDIDGDNRDIVFEYNYSHDNHGGFFLIVNHLVETATVRYNVSKNDSFRAFEIPRVSYELDKIEKISIYNNTIYSTHPYTGGTNGSHFILLNMGNSDTKNIFLQNNIFCITASNVITNTPDSATRNISNNLFWGSAKAQENALKKADKHPIVADPMFVNLNAGADGLRLRAGSPALNAGAVIGNNGGRDFWNNAVSSTGAPNVGAYNGHGL